MKKSLSTSHECGSISMARNTPTVTINLIYIKKLYFSTSVILACKALKMYNRIYYMNKLTFSGCVTVTHSDSFQAHGITVLINIIIESPRCNSFDTRAEGQSNEYSYLLHKNTCHTALTLIYSCNVC